MRVINAAPQGMHSIAVTSSLLPLPLGIEPYSEVLLCIVRCYCVQRGATFDLAMAGAQCSRILRRVWMSRVTGQANALEDINIDRG